jgi:hypothetical protein
MQKFCFNVQSFITLLKSSTPYTLAGFDLMTHSSNLLGGRRRRYHFVDYADSACNCQYFIGKLNPLNRPQIFKAILHRYMQKRKFS